MRRLIVVIPLMLTWSGCASTQPVSDETGNKDAPVSACVQTCTDARRVEAMDWSAIVAECEASCADASSAP